MLERLREKNTSLLEKHAIVDKSQILSKSILRLAGTRGTYFLNKRDHGFYCDDNSTRINLILPQPTQEDRRKLFDYLEVPLSEITSIPYHSKIISIPIKPDVMFNKIFPAYESHINSLERNNRNAYRHYQLNSRPTLINTYYIKIHEATKNLLEKLDGKCNNTNSLTILANARSALTVFGQRKPYTYSISDGDSLAEQKASLIEIQSFLNKNDNISDETLKSELMTLKNTTDKSLRYLFLDERIAVSDALDQLHNFLDIYKISAEHCGIFIDSLLQLAHIKETPYHSKLEYNETLPGCVQLSIHLTSQINITTLCYWLNGFHGSHSISTYNGMNSYTITIDGLIFQRYLLPQFRQWFCNEFSTIDNSCIKQYQRDSRKVFPSEKKNLKASVTCFLKSHLFSKHHTYNNTSESNDNIFENEPGHQLN